jgi:hypothetical protein
MNRAVLIGVTYSLFVIAFKLSIIFGGYGLTKFGFNYSHIISVFAVIPFMIMAIKLKRDKEQNGIIGGKQAAATALTVVFIAAVILSIYTYFEFEYAWKHLSEKYYSSKEFYQSYLNYYEKHPKEKHSPFNEVVFANLSSMDAFKAVTIRLFSFMFVGLSSAFICAVFMKRRAA